MGTLRLTPREQRLLDTANGQLGLLRHEQLIALGLTQNAIQGRRESGRLTRVQAGVYALGHTALRDDGRWLAALWASGPHDALSHATAGAFHGWRIDDPAGAIHLSTTGAGTTRGDLVVHRVRRLDPPDVFRTHPFRVTTIPRTLVDLADVMAWADYRALADSLPHLRVDKIRQAQQRAPGRAGRGRVARLIQADDAHTKSAFERRFLRFLRSQRLPRPAALNVPVAGHRADCVYRGARGLVVELDGRAYHERRAAMRADRLRDTDYQLTGFLILRLVWDDLHPDAAGSTAGRVRRMLRAAGRAA